MMERPEANMTPQFGTTVWSQINAAGDTLHPDNQSAIEQLLRKYWKPVFYFVRTRRYTVEEAEDLTQEFFFRLCDRRWLQRADRERGRFRTFLLTLLTRFLADQSGHRAQRQGQFERKMVPLSGLLKDEDRSFEPDDARSAEAIFLDQWVGGIVTRACEDVRKECQTQGRETWYAVFDACLLREPADRLSQSEAARVFELTRDQIRHALSQVREQLKRRLIEELRLDGCPKEEVESELDSLFELLQ